MCVCVGGTSHVTGGPGEVGVVEGWERTGWGCGGQPEERHHEGGVQWC